MDIKDNHTKKKEPKKEPLVVTIQSPTEADIKIDKIEKGYVIKDKPHIVKWK